MVVDWRLVLLGGAMDRSAYADTRRSNFVRALLYGSVLESLPPISVAGSCPFAATDLGGSGDGELLVFHLLHPSPRTSPVCDGSTVSFIRGAEPRLAERIRRRQPWGFYQLLVA